MRIIIILHLTDYHLQTPYNVLVYGLWWIVLVPEFKSVQTVYRFHSHVGVNYKILGVPVRRCWWPSTVRPRVPGPRKLCPHADHGPADRLVLGAGDGVHDGGLLEDVEQLVSVTSAVVESGDQGGKPDDSRHQVEENLPARQQKHVTQWRCACNMYNERCSSIIW